MELMDHPFIQEIPEDTGMVGFLLEHYHLYRN